MQSLREELGKNIFEHIGRQREEWGRLLKSNNEQLSSIKEVVEEKLQGTLETKLSASFRQVSDRLQQVHEGLGEMKNLAHGVGDLKRVLSNIKSRGTWGEYQLGHILQDVLTPNQYEKNVSIGSGIVEYAVKLPGQTPDAPVYLPIDSKFPQEDYIKIRQAEEDGNDKVLKTATASLEKEIKKQARLLRDKYIIPPKTTDFALMFLPTEGLFAEVLRRPNLGDFLQRECRILLAGPTTLGALLNALSVGFQTLAIQKRSFEVWKLLEDIRSQFGTFSGHLEKVQKKIHEASDEMDKASKKSKAIEKGLTKVKQLPESDMTDIS